MFWPDNHETISSSDADECLQRSDLTPIPRFIGSLFKAYAFEFNEVFGFAVSPECYWVRDRGSNDYGQQILLSNHFVLDLMVVSCIDQLIECYQTAGVNAEVDRVFQRVKRITENGENQKVLKTW